MKVGGVEESVTVSGASQPDRRYSERAHPERAVTQRPGCIAHGAKSSSLGLDRYDIAPAKFGLVKNLVTLAERFGKQSEVFNGVDLTVNARLGRGASLSGGLGGGTTTIDRCAQLDF
jgi:hypothetical protein